MDANAKLIVTIAVVSAITTALIFRVAAIRQAVTGQM